MATLGVKMNDKAMSERGPAVRELRDSLLLLVLAAASVGTYIAVGIVAVRLFAR